jgi:hypothetical protein
MKIQRFLFAAIGAFVFFVVVNAVFSSVLFPEGPYRHYRNLRPEPLAVFGIVAALITALLMAYIFPMGYKGGKLTAEGLRFGMLLGVLVSLPANLQLYGAAVVPFDGLLTVILWTIITWGIAGAIIAAIYGKTLGQAPDRQPKGRISV